MIELIPRIKQHFDSLQDRFICFHEMGFETEGWFKGELLTAFGQLQNDKLIQELDREVMVATGRIDIKIQIKNIDHWIELKHRLIGRQKGNTYNPSSFLGDRTSATGITKDVDKLNALTGYRWMLILMTGNPGANAWEAGVEKFNEKFAPRRIKQRTHPDDFPPSYFLGLLDVVLES